MQKWNISVYAILFIILNVIAHSLCCVNINLGHSWSRMVTHVFIEEKIISINYGLHLSLDLPNDDEGDRIYFRFLQVLDYQHMHKNLQWWIINALLIKLKYSIATNRGFSWLITRFFVSRIRQYIYRNALLVEVVHKLSFTCLYNVQLTMYVHVCVCVC